MFILEGEKDVDAAWALGIPATCNAGGAKKWRTEHAAYLQDADVVIIPDNDAAGHDHAHSVAISLSGIARRVRFLELPGLSNKGDFSDWPAGRTAEQLWSLVETARDYDARRTRAGRRQCRLQALLAYLFRPANGIRKIWSPRRTRPRLAVTVAQENR